MCGHSEQTFARIFACTFQKWGHPRTKFDKNSNNSWFKFQIVFSVALQNKQIKVTEIFGRPELGNEIPKLKSHCTIACTMITPMTPSWNCCHNRRQQEIFYTVPFLQWSSRNILPTNAKRKGWRNAIKMATSHSQSESWNLFVHCLSPHRTASNRFII